MNITTSVLAAVTLVGLRANAASAFSLIGSELDVRFELQQTPTSDLIIGGFPVSAIVSESLVEFPSAGSGIPIDGLPGIVTLGPDIDAGADYLEVNFRNAGTGTLASLFRNDIVFIFTAPLALQITGAAISPTTTLGLTPNRISFSGNELRANFSGLPFTPDSVARLNLTTVAISDPVSDPHPNADAAAVPEPSTMLMMGGAAAIGTLLKRRNHLRKSQG